MDCLPCVGSRKAALKAADSSNARPAPKPANRLNLAPQELYQVDDYPIELEEAQRWVVNRKAKPDAEYRMICLPWAGGSSSIYVGWELPNVEVVSIELPGRQARQREKPYDYIHPMAARMTEALDALGYLRKNAKKLIIFGHSFGSLIAIEVVRALRVAYDFTPYYLIAAGGIPPRDRWDTKISKDDDDKIIATILEWGTVTPAVAASPEMKTVHVPVIRADHHCLDHFVNLEVPPVSCPILAIVATEDPLYHGGVGSRWQSYTTSTFTLRNVKCHHYFPYSAREATLAVIKSVVLDGNTTSDPVVIPKGAENEPDWRGKPQTYSG